jgi:hypothetical protein
VGRFQSGIFDVILLPPKGHAPDLWPSFSFNVRAWQFARHFVFKRISVIPSPHSNHSEISPFLTGVVIFLGPALVCWIGLIEAALSIWHRFHLH